MSKMPVSCRAASLLMLALFCIISRTATGGSVSPPRMISEVETSSEKAYKFSEDVTLRCQADEESRSTYTWFKDGSPFYPNASNIRRLTDQGGSFIIRNTDNDDEGVYQCFASNAFGTAVTRKLTLKKAVLDAFPTFPTVTHRPLVGTPHVLQCRPPRSYPSAAIYWGTNSPGSSQLKSIENNDRVVLGYDGHLYFANVVADDAKPGFRYVCIANNKILGAHVQGQDQIIQPVEPSGSPPEAAPSLLWMSPKRDVAIRGQDKKMKCIFSGLPTPRVTWSRVDAASNRFAVTDAGHGTEIEIKHVDFDDAGTYRGTAQNGVGEEAQCNIVLIVESAPYWRQNKIPADVEADDEDDVELECLADGRPRPNITWSLNGQLISDLPEDPRRSTEGYRLRIANVNQSDAAIVQCTTANEHGFILANVILSVAASAPSFATTPEDTRVVEGGNAVMTCKVFGAPKPRITWLRGNAEDPEQISDDRFIQHPNGNLEIRGAVMDDADAYHCVATNKFGSEKASGSLVVRQPTTIRRPEESEIVANVTDDVRIPCDVRTDPAERSRLRVEWRRDGQPIDVRAGHLTVNSTDFSLHVSGAEVQDTAGYTCHASNGLDEATSEVTRVTVRGRPDPPADLRVTACREDYAALSWSPSVENNSPVIEYIIYATDSSSAEPDRRAEVTRLPSRRSRSGAADPSPLTATVQTNPWATYVYSVVATNALGVSDPANGTDEDGDGRDDTKAVCVTPETAPKRNPRGVCTRLERPRQLKIVWEPLPRPEHNSPGFHYRVGYRLLGRAPDGGQHPQLTSDVPDSSSGELVIYNQEQFRQYEVFVQSVNARGEALLLPGERKIGYSGEGKPLDSPQSLKLNAASLNSTYAEFSWEAVDTSQNRILGFFRGYRLQYWRVDNPRDIRTTSIIIGQPPQLCQPIGDSLPSRRRRHHHPQHHGGRHRRAPPPTVYGAAADLWPYAKIRAGVSVLNQGSEGALSDTIEFTTPEGVPSPVASLQVVEQGSDHLTVRWEKPLFPNGLLLSYTLEYQVAKPNVGPLHYVTVRNPKQTSKRLMNLEPKTEYRVWIAAATSVGVGQSVFADGTTLEVSDPDVPAIGFIEVGDDSANVTWQPSAREPSSNPAGNFYVEYIKASDAESGQWNRSDPTPEAADAGENWVKIGNLTPGEQYLFRVVAVNGLDPDTRESRSDPPWKERIGPPVDTHDPTAQPVVVEPDRASAGWFIILMCIIVMLLLLLLIACLIQRTRGQQYPVYEKEKAWGHDPNAPEDAPFNEYTRNNEPSDAGRGSLGSDEKPDDASDMDSLGEYDDQDPSKFNEDGSFIGQYTRKPGSPRTPSGPTPGYNTFV